MSCFRCWRLVPSFCLRNISLPAPKRVKQRLTWRKCALLVFPATCFGLGYWQIGRRKWKLDLIERLENSIRAAPTPLPLNVQKSTDLPEYSPVTVRGQFDHSREVLIGPRPLIDDFITPHGMGSEWSVTRHSDHSSKTPYRHTATPIPGAYGYFVVTPFFLADRPGMSILVNRGWVHLDSRDPSLRSKGQVSGNVELSGFIRYPETPPPLSPDVQVLPCKQHKTQYPHLQYCCRLIDSMAKQLDTLPILIDANYESTVPSGPIGGQTRIQLRNEHASYIFTWFSLGFIGAGMWIYWFVL